MELNEEIRMLIEQHDKEVRSRAINEFYTAICNHYKIYKCVPSISFIGEIIAENLKGESE